LYGAGLAAEFVLNPQGPEFKTIQDIFAAESKKVCFHDSLYVVMERDYPTNTDNFYNSSANDINRLNRLQTNDECDGVVISQYSLSFISTQIDSCDGLYPLYDEELFTQDVIVPISQTLEGLGDELINIMDIMANKNLYRDNHDDHVANLGEECKFRALNDRKRFGWKLFLFPIVIQCLWQ